MNSPPSVIEQPQVIIPEPRESDVHEVLYEVQRIRVELAEEGLEDQVEVSMEKNGVKIRISTPFLFPAASDDLRSKNSGVIQRLGNVLSKGDNTVQVEGHTDNIPISSAEFPSNWELSTGRALAVVKQLRASGVGADGASLVAVGCAAAGCWSTCQLAATAALVPSTKAHSASRLS